MSHLIFALEARLRSSREQVDEFSVNADPLIDLDKDSDCFASAAVAVFPSVLWRLAMSLRVRQ